MTSLRAFTLIEILVVLAIIGVLAAILFPAFSSARERSRTAVCANNLRQIGMAVNLYANDYNDFYPPVALFTLAPDMTGCWANRIYPYIRSEEIFECPNLEEGDFRLSGSPSLITSEINKDEYNHVGSYSPNDLATATALKVQRTRLNHPSDTIFALDGIASNPWVRPIVSPMNTTADLEKSGVPRRHDDGANVLMADGRVKWMRLEDMLEPSLWTARKP